MFRYTVKRIVQMIPILFGVILLTFIMFNVIGGSPAAMVLGQHATAQALEEFDEQRGFNKPLLFGMWTQTRAFEDVGFLLAPVLWQEKPQDARHRPVAGCVELQAGSAYRLPLNFALYPRTRYRWIVEAQPSKDATAVMRVRDAKQVQETALAAGRGRDTYYIDFTTGDNTADIQADIEVSKGTLDVYALRLRRGMAHPLDSQLVDYLRRLCMLDLGVSAQTHQRVSTMLKQGIVPSLTLTVPIFAGGLILAVVIALICAYFRDRWIDRSLIVLATVLMSVNYIVWVVLGQYILAYRLNWFPVWGYESWCYLLLPVLIGITTGLGRDVRFYRTVMLDEMYREYIRTAIAKGAGPVRVLFRHVLRNALVPVITNVSMSIPYLFMGSILLESYFGIPGVGNMSINAIHSSDVDVIRAVVIIGAVLYMVANLVTDLCYAWVDPRVRLK